MHNRPIDDFIYRRFLQYSFAPWSKQMIEVVMLELFGIVILTDFDLDQT
jgi:hypothetical protein